MNSVTKTVLITILASALLCSCQKEHTCVCEDGKTTERINIAESTRDHAQDVCDDYESYWSLSGGTCTLE